MKLMAWAALIALGGSGAASAASFDCGNAVSKVEHLVCADPELSTLDERLGAAYKTALARSSKAAELRSDQARWLKSRRNACADANCLRAAYQARLADLADVTPPYENLPDAIDHACMALAATIPTEVSHCRVTGAADFGTLGAETLHYAIYCLDESTPTGAHCERSGIALFSADASRKRVTRWHLSSDDAGNNYAAPQLLRSQGHTLLAVPVGIPGSGDFNASELFLRQGDRWLPVDNTSWEKHLTKRLPKGLAARKGIWPDYTTMTATTGLYRAKDANCCPTGGSATIRLSLQGTRLSLSSLWVSDKAPR